MLAIAPSSRPILTGVAATLLLAGCNSGPSATTPPASNNQTAILAPSIPIGRTGDLETGLATMGLYDFHLDRVNGTFELSPARAATANGDAFTIDLTTAFTTGTFGCADCLSIASIAHNTSGPSPVLNVTFQATHPFPTSDIAGRADLHVNNVRLAFLVNGTDSFFVGSAIGDAELLANPDGFIKLPATFVAPPPGLTSTLFPFTVFQTGDNLGDPNGNFDATIGWSGAVNDPQGYNVLKMGGTATTTAAFILEPGDTKVLDGQIAVLANFVASATFETRPNPTYFMPEGAMPEAWHVSVIGPDGLTEEATDQNGTVSVHVTDWQAGAAIDPGFPNPGNPMDIKTGGSVASVSVNIPAFNATPAPVTTPASGSGTLADPWVFDVVISKPASVTTVGSYIGLVKVLDERTPFNALDKSLDVATGLSSLSELATYQTFTAEVEAGTGGYEPPLLGPATLFAPSSVTNDQPSGTLLGPGTASNLIDSYGDNVVMILKKQAADFKAFAVASNDGGTTWGTPLALDPAATGGGATSFRGIGVAFNADGSKVFIGGTEFSSGNPIFNRLDLSGNALTLDAQIRAVDLGSVIGPTTTTFEFAMAAHLTDPEIMYVLGDDSDGTLGTRRVLMMSVANAKSAATPGALVLDGLGGVANGAAWTTDPSYTGVFDPCLAIGPDGDLFGTFDPNRAMSDPGIFIHWDSGTDTFSTPVVFDGVIDPVFGDFAESRIAVGPDGRPVIVFTEAISDAVKIMKAGLTAAPWNFSVPINVDPDYDKVAQGVQLTPDLTIDSTTGRIHVTVGDFRDAPTESQETPTLLCSLFESIFEPDLALTIDGRKIDDLGMSDNTDGDRNLRIHILQRGTPTTKRWLYFWQDADAKNPAPGPDLLYKIGE